MTIGEICIADGRLPGQALNPVVCGGTTNVVRNALDRHRHTSLWERDVIDWEGEGGSRRTWIYAESDRLTCRLANARGELRIGKSDVVARYMPMLPETAENARQQHHERRGDFKKRLQWLEGRAVQQADEADVE